MQQDDDATDPFSLGPRLVLGAEPHETAHLPIFYRGPIDVDEQRRMIKLCLNRMFPGVGVRMDIYKWYEGTLAVDVKKRVILLCRDVLGREEHDYAIKQQVFDEIWGYMLKYAGSDEPEPLYTCTTEIIEAAKTNQSWAWQLAGILTSLLEEHALAGYLPRKLMLVLYYVLAAALYFVRTGARNIGDAQQDRPSEDWLNDIVDRLLDAGLGNQILALEDVVPNIFVLAAIVVGSIVFRREGRHFGEWNPPCIAYLTRFKNSENTENQQRIRAWARQRQLELLQEDRVDALD